jgi:D-xylulose reductase
MRFAAAPPDSPGTLAKYFRVAEDFVYKVPEGVALDEAVLVEPLAVAVHAVKLGDVRPGEVVVIMGAGTVGLLCASVARVFGARNVVIVDILEKKLQFAKGFLKEGTIMFHPNHGHTAEEEAETLSEGQGADVVIEASGAARAIETGIHSLRPGGKYVQTGLGKPKVEFPIVALSEKELLVRGCFRYGSGDFELAMELLRSGAVQVKSLITASVDFQDATQAWDMTARGEGIKNLIVGVQD